MSCKRQISNMFEALYAAYGPQRWWPTTLPGDAAPSYHGLDLDESGRFEVAVGAILTQNTNWRNVERAIVNLHAAALLAPERLLAADTSAVEQAVKPSGYYRMKTVKLMNLARWWQAKVGGHPLPTPGLMDEWRLDLLAVKGVGPETADSILLYAFCLPTFVVDAYTRRIMACRLGTPREVQYDNLRRLFMDTLPPDVGLYKEFHALFVRLGKDCRTCGKASEKKCPNAAWIG